MTEKESNKSKKERRRYDKEFRRAAVEHYKKHGRELSRTAQELGINHWTLRDWLDADKAADQPPKTERTVTELEAENRRLANELARVTEQRDILKKSLGILSTT